MHLFLSEKHFLKQLESPAVYDSGQDELYELDDAGFLFLSACASPEGCHGSSADSEFIDYCLSEGILKTTPVHAKRAHIAEAQFPSLRYLELQITDKCNLQCRHCYIGPPTNKELSLMQLEEVLRQFEAMQGLRLLITGGEPLMHTQFHEFNEILPVYCFRKILFTNGLKINRQNLKSLNVDEIQFSVDGMRRGHDMLRGEGTFRLLMRSVEAALDAGFQVSVSTMVHAGNIPEFDDMEKLFRKLGIRDWTVDVPCPQGNLKKNRMLNVAPGVAGRLMDYGFGGGLHTGEEGFGCGLHLAAVTAAGNVCKCAFYSATPAGHISGGLANAWKQIKPVKLSDLECSGLSCKVIEECRGGCRYRASVMCEGADIVGTKRDIYKCFQFGTLQREGSYSCDNLI